MFTEVLRVYSEKFKTVARIMLPLFVCQIVILALSIVYNIFKSPTPVGSQVLFAIFIPVALILISLVQGLLYMPAALRTFQKKEEGQEVAMKESVVVQRKNMWQFFKLAIFFILFSLWYAVFSIIPGGFLIWLAFHYVAAMGYVSAMLVAFVGCIIVVFGMYLNYSKVFFPINIYFSKELNPLETMKESIRIGEQYRNDVWRAFGVFAVLTVSGLLVVMCLAYIVSPQEFLATMSIKNYQPAVWYDALIGLFSILVSVGVTAPLSYMYMSKAYTAIKKKDEGGVVEEAAVGE